MVEGVGLFAVLGKSDEFWEVDTTEPVARGGYRWRNDRCVWDTALEVYAIHRTVGWDGLVELRTERIPLSLAAD